MVLAACSAPSGSHRQDFAASTSTSPQPRPTSPAATSPTPVKLLAEGSPIDPGAMADELTRVDHLLARNVRRWQAAGEPVRSPLARSVSALGLRQQKIYRYLTVHPRLARKVETKVGQPIKQEMQANLGAAADLNSLVSPVAKVPRYRFAHPLAPKKLRRLYLEAQRRYGVPWSVLAAINFVESKFGRILGPSSAGALGPMQFLPSTFAAYGRGDITDPRDSILAAARYLRASGGGSRLKPALFAYNHAHAYVDAVLRYARQMRANDWSFWAYYGYQVFVTTTRGSVRLTGPGTDHPDHTPGRPAPT